MSYEVRELAPDRFDAISASWQEIAGSDEFNSELKIPLGHLLSLLTDGAVHSSGDGSGAPVLEVYDVATGECVAIVDVINSDRKQQTKILKHVLSPSLWIQGGADEETRNKIARILSDTYTQIIHRNIYIGQMEEVKIYGRDDVTLQLLAMILKFWDDDLALKAELQGRWLSVTRISESPVLASVEG